LESVRLVLTAELAADYFTLRQLDTQIALLRRTVETLQKGLDLVNSRHAGGVASGLDVTQEETLLNTTRTQAILLRQERKQFEDAIAVLTGKPAPDFHVAERPLAAEPPNLETSLPSDLLERRPDIAESERQMAIANAQSGLLSFTRALWPGWLECRGYIPVAQCRQRFLGRGRESCPGHFHRRRPPRAGAVLSGGLRRCHRRVSRYGPQCFPRSARQP